MLVQRSINLRTSTIPHTGTALYNSVNNLVNGLSGVVTTQGDAELYLTNQYLKNNNIPLKKAGSP